MSFCFSICLQSFIFCSRFLSIVALISSSSVLLTLFLIFAISNHWCSSYLTVFTTIEYVLRMVITIVYILPYLFYTNSLIFLAENPEENYSLFLVYLVFGMLMHSYYFLLSNLYVSLIVTLSNTYEKEGD